MAYDAATGTAVLFGGDVPRRTFGDTWTWDGTTWTRQAPPVHPRARFGAAMAYDAATGTVVLFGGTGRHGDLGDTWTWDGTTWTKQHPAVHPPARSLAAMAYDAATSTAVLFGGFGQKLFGDTWTWDGTTWTKRPRRPARPPALRGRWPMTRPPAPRCCSAVTTAATASFTTSLTPGRGDDPSSGPVLQAGVSSTIER